MAKINLQSILKDAIGPAVNLLTDLQNDDMTFPVAASANSNATTNATPALAAAANDKMNSATVLTATPAVNCNATLAAANIISAINFLLTDATRTQPVLEPPSKIISKLMIYLLVQLWQPLYMTENGLKMMKD